MTQEQNPLAQFYRKVKFSIKLPSRGNFYKEGTIHFNEENEVDILPMTASDEIILKNPDALLTGKAISEVIRSCAPGVSAPRKLLACDVDALMIAIRRASYGDEANMKVACIKCEHENTFGLDLETLLNQSESLDQSYEVIVPPGLTIFLSPGTFDTMNKQNKAIFENAKVQRALTASGMTDDAALSLLTKAFNTMSKLNFELIADAISKIVYTDESDNEPKEISNRKHIEEFLKNIDKKTVDIIDNEITKINKIGIAKTVDAVCQNCNEKWEAPIEFNPVNFS